MGDRQYILALATLAGVVGMWLLLPRGTARGRMAGAGLMAAALGLWASQAIGLSNWLEDAVFLSLAGVTVVAAVATVTLRNPIYCAIWFGLTLLGTAGLMLFAGAQFLAVATIVVYAGAILVTFLFVLMLAQPEGRAAYDRTSWEALVSATVGIVIVGVLSMTVSSAWTAPPSEPAAAQGATMEELAAGVLTPQHVAAFGTELFSRHLVAVEVAGTLLLAALVGAAAIAGQARTRQPAPPAAAHGENES